MEYAGQTGPPQWVAPGKFTWDCRAFTQPGTAVQAAVDHAIDLSVDKRNAAQAGFNVWTLNGTPYSMDTIQPVIDIEADKRYRLRFRNATDDIHPIHLHRRTFEVTNIAGTPTSGLLKDVVMLRGYQTLGGADHGGGLRAGDQVGADGDKRAGPEGHAGSTGSSAGSRDPAGQRPSAPRRPLQPRPPHTSRTNPATAPMVSVMRLLADPPVLLVPELLGFAERVNEPPGQALSQLAHRYRVPIS